MRLRLTIIEMNALGLVLLACTVAAIVVWLFLGTHGMLLARWFMQALFPDVPRTTPEELTTWLNNKSQPPPVLLDVRSPEEFAVSHLPGAVRCDCNLDAKAVLVSLPKDRPVVVYCAAGYRSTKMTRRLAQAGMKKIYDLEGGVFAWAKQHGALERDGQPVTEVHSFNAMGKRMLKGK